VIEPWSRVSNLFTMPEYTTQLPLSSLQLIEFVCVVWLCYASLDLVLSSYLFVSVRAWEGGRIREMRKRGRGWKPMR
jgi:hypothetical protein